MSSGTRMADQVALDLGESAAPFALAREWVTANTPYLGEARRTDLLLVANALIGNAVKHADGPRRVRLCRTDRPSAVRVEVDDGSPGRLPVLGRPTVSAPGRWGLLMVNRLSSNWGVRQHADHKTVWAEVAQDDLPAGGGGLLPGATRPLW